MTDRDTTASIDALLGRMSWADKLNQLQIVWRRDPEEAAQLARNGIGALFWPPTAEAANELQRVAVEESEHGIPLLIGLDVVHGQFTIFPTPLAQAASFDPAVAELDGRISAAEARSAGVNWTFSPMVDVSRDPRWGRVVEGFGEDAYLTGVFGAAKVRGYQGQSLASPDAILACLKHYTGYGLAEGGRDYNTADLSEHRLRSTYLEPFRVAVAAGAASVMASFNTLNGVPMHANRRLLTDVLKTDWGHEGIVVGDADGVAQLVPHGVATDVADAVRLALGAGLDVEMGGNVVSDSGEPILQPGEVDEARIDDAVRRVLRLKFALGLFDRPYVAAPRAATAATASTRAAARTAAERSTVLLKNDGNLLPLAPGARRVLLTGPYARSTDHLGAWVQHFATPAGSLEDALRELLPDAVELTVADGADFLRPDDGLLAEAVAEAQASDLVIVAVGEPSSLSGEAASRSDIRLPGDQERLLTALADTGVPFVVVLATGRPLDVSAWIDRAPSVLLTWHLGTEAAPAIARTLLGEVNPGGRLPMSFPVRSARCPSTTTTRRPDVRLSAAACWATTGPTSGSWGPPTPAATTRRSISTCPSARSSTSGTGSATRGSSSMRSPSSPRSHRIGSPRATP
ncbi:glycoside hydrolase family 3 N-terminal domain-containing protein [Naasia aerilata]|uniref:beta-glucosidase n=1 Tax=Naasia aerilata TaxID=1162966 RepID=A0ABN6XHS8_9MICO|nr:glycoside hydrolase family 3 N-terminal domain-containing protein [Naasia aerilata]BDZ44473.1 hypothetical protein GCM10025866_03820 [Naasia aerilata]